MVETNLFIVQDLSNLCTIELNKAIFECKKKNYKNLKGKEHSLNFTKDMQVCIYSHPLFFEIKISHLSTFFVF